MYKLLKVHSLSFYPDEENDDRLRVYINFCFDKNTSKDPKAAKTPSGLIFFQRKEDDWIIQAVRDGANVTLNNLLSEIGPNRLIGVDFVKPLNDKKGLFLVNLNLTPAK